MTVECPHALPTAKATVVQCKLGLYGGNPHIAICRQCKKRPQHSVDLDEPVKMRRVSRIKRMPRHGSGGQTHSRIDHLTRQRILLRNFQSPGDIVMLTAAVRDLYKAHANRFEIAVETSCSALWQFNPYITRARNRSDGFRVINCQYPLIHRSNQVPYHFIHAFTQNLESQLGVQIPVTEFRGDIHLPEEERESSLRWLKELGIEGEYWIIVAGGKYDFTAKWWDPARYQQVVDHFQGKVKFVQCGESKHWHPPLRGVMNLVGKTDLRQFVQLMYHSSGVVCPVTMAMHLAAAVPTKTPRIRPCVVIAGGREPNHWEAYPGHQYLHTIGMLSCCANGGCWKSRCQPVGDGDAKDLHNCCEFPVAIAHDLLIPRCMDYIRIENVISSIDGYLGTMAGSSAPLVT